MAFYRPRSSVFVTPPSIYLPAHEVDNEELAAWLEVRVPPAWIARRTGIRTRRWVADDQAVSDIAVEAATTLLALWPDRRKSIRQVILATISGDSPIPPSAPLVQHRLGLERTGCIDLGAACAGFASALYAASAFCEATGETQLVIAADIRSKFLDRRDPATAVLFGDGAAACLVGPDPGLGGFRFDAGELLSDGSVADIVCLAAGGSRLPCHWERRRDQSFLKMKDGPRVFLLAAEGMATAARSLLHQLEMAGDQVDWVVPHQANLHLVREVARLLGCPAGRVVETVQAYGNTSGSSVGLALHDLCGNPSLLPGHRVLLVSAGGGGLAATALLTKVAADAR